MGVLDIESLLHEIRPEAPCGEDISRDSGFLELGALIQPRPPSAIKMDGEPQTVEPNWTEIRKRSLALLQQSRDLQVSLYFSLALFITEGLPGLCDGLHLIHRLLERFWDDLHPRLDPEDNNDPTERINILRPLFSEPRDEWDPVRFRSRLLRLPLCNARGVGGFSLRDVQIARGESPGADGGREAPQMTNIQAAFRGTPADELQNTLRVAQEAVSHLDGIRSVFQEHTQDGSGPEFGELRGDLERICRVFSDCVGTGAPAADGTPHEASGAPVGEPIPMTGDVRSQQAALAAIEQACRYFERHEPSSPVPLLLRRAQRLARKTFLEIIADVCPNAMDQVAVVSGTSGDGINDTQGQTNAEQA